MKDYFQNIDVERQKEIDNCVSKLRNCLSIIRGELDVTDYSIIFFFMHLKHVGLLRILKTISEDINEEIFYDKNQKIFKARGTGKIRNSSQLIKEEFIKILSSRETYNLPTEIYDVFFNNEILNNPEYYTNSHQTIRQLSKDLNLFEDRVINRSSLLIKFIDSILEINELENQDLYPYIFDGLLYDLTNQKGSFSDALLLEEVSWYISFISRLHNPNSVYNPFAGFCSFNIFSDHRAKYFGQEINQDTVAIGMLRLMANECDPKQLQKSDSMFEWNPQKKKYDLIIFNPPFFNGVDDRNKLLISLSKSLEDLSDNGKLFCVMPIKLLGRRSYRFVRSLVDQDLIESIISLPHNSHYNTSIDSEVIIISKSKQLKGSINFCKLDYWFDNKKRYTKGARIQSFVKNLPKDFPSKYVNEESSIVISNKELREEYDYDLSVGNKLVKKFKGVRIGELLDNYRERGEYKTNDYFIKIADLSSNINSFELELDKMRSLDNDPKSLDQTILGAHSGRANRRFVCLKEDVLLIANRHLNLKPSYYKNSDKNVFLSTNVSAYTIDKKKILPEFLINELYSDTVNAQIELLRKGSTIPYISTNDFLSIRIELPDINEQKVIINALNKRSSEIKKYQDQIDLLEQESSDEVKNKFIEEASLRHSTGTARANLSSYFKVLNKFFSSDDNDILKVRNLYKTKKGNDLINVFDDMERDLEFINSHIRKDTLSDYPLDYVSLEDFLKCLKECTIPDQKFEIKISDILFKSGEYIISNAEDEKKVIVPSSSNPMASYDGFIIRTNLDLIKTVITNILTNANKHAFDESSSKNTVYFEGSLNHSWEMSIEIGNNGKPFEEGYSKANFIAIHNTTNKSIGKGMGGYDIARHLKHLDCNWDLDLTNDLFPVIFNLNFNVIMQEAVDDLKEIQDELEKEDGLSAEAIKDIKQIQSEIDIENEVPIEDLKQIQSELEKEAGLSAEEIEDIKQIQANMKKK